ncbi:hypothetical protein CR513_33031, partial [Mucuna pruriens]
MSFFARESEIKKTFFSNQPMLDEVPSVLPTIRGIEHHIDLISGVALPNRPTYKRKPNETIEIQKQVFEKINGDKLNSRMNLFK